MRRDRRHVRQLGADSATDRAHRPLSGWLAIALVTGTSAAVLVLEILAGRLLAPYVGVSLETFTGIIGTILAGIAVGAWVGGVAADHVDPRRLLPVLLVLGGALAIATIPIVRVLGEGSGAGGGGARILILTAFGFLPSATVLSAVPPAVIKLQLLDLASTGTTVGRLSAWSTAGALFGTFFTGFVLVSAAAVTTLIVAVGLVLIVAGVAMWVVDPRGLDRRDAEPRWPRRGVAGRCRGGRLAVRDPDRVLLPVGGRGSEPRLGPHARARRPAAQLRRPRRPDAARVLVHPSDRRRHRGPCGRARRTDRRRVSRRGSVHRAALRAGDPARERPDDPRDRRRPRRRGRGADRLRPW